MKQTLLLTMPDTVGTPSEMHDRLSVVLSEPIVALAQGIFHSLVEFDKLNYNISMDLLCLNPL